MFLGAALVSPLVGKALDRFSIRLVLPLGAIIFSLALIGIAFSNSLLAMAVLLFLPTAIGFMSIGPLTTATLASRWFYRRRGLALGLAAVATSGGGFTVVPLLSRAIQQYGWRLALIYEAAIMAIIIVVLALLYPARQARRTWGSTIIGKIRDGKAIPRGQGPPAMFRCLVLRWQEYSQQPRLLDTQHRPGNGFGYISGAGRHIGAVWRQPGPRRTFRSGDDIRFRDSGGDHQSLCRCAGGSHQPESVADCGGGSDDAGLADPGPVREHAALYASACMAGVALGCALPTAAALIAGYYGPARFGAVMGWTYTFIGAISITASVSIGYIFDRLGGYHAAFLIFSALLTCVLAATLLFAPARKAA